MTKNTKMIIVSIIVIILVGGVVFFFAKSRQPAPKNIAGETNIKEKPITAKEAYKIAKVYANKWANDSVLVEITNFQGTNQTDGTANRWKVRFYSPQKEKDLQVHIVGGEYMQDLESTHMSLAPTGDEWADSDVAVAKAMEHLANDQCKNIWLGLSGNQWRVKCSRTSGAPKWIIIGAQNGEFMQEYEDY